jgi:hypothetical protein
MQRPNTALSRTQSNVNSIGLKLLIRKMDHRLNSMLESMAEIKKIQEPTRSHKMLDRQVGDGQKHDSECVAVVNEQCQEPQVPQTNEMETLKALCCQQMEEIQRLTKDVHIAQNALVTKGQHVKSLEAEIELMKEDTKQLKIQLLHSAEEKEILERKIADVGEKINVSDVVALREKQLKLKPPTTVTKTKNHANCAVNVTAKITRQKGYSWSSEEEKTSKAQRKGNTRPPLAVVKDMQEVKGQQRRRSSVSENLNGRSLRGADNDDDRYEEVVHRKCSTKRYNGDHDEVGTTDEAASGSNALTSSSSSSSSSSFHEKKWPSSSEVCDTTGPIRTAHFNPKVVIRQTEKESLLLEAASVEITNLEIERNALRHERDAAVASAKQALAENVRLVGHRNPQQRIKYMEALKDENNKLHAKLRAVEAKLAKHVKPQRPEPDRDKGPWNRYHR